MSAKKELITKEEVIGNVYRLFDDFLERFYHYDGKRLVKSSNLTRGNIQYLKEKVIDIIKKGDDEK